MDDRPDLGGATAAKSLVALLKPKFSSEHAGDILVHRRGDTASASPSCCCCIPIRHQLNRDALCFAAELCLLSGFDQAGLFVPCCTVCPQSTGMDVSRFALAGSHINLVADAAPLGWALAHWRPVLTLLIGVPARLQGSRQPLGCGQSSPRNKS
jgi:hypothetical protein